MPSDRPNRCSRTVTPPSTTENTPTGNTSRPRFSLVTARASATRATAVFGFIDSWPRGAVVSCVTPAYHPTSTMAPISPTTRAPPLPTCSIGRSCPKGCPLRKVSQRCNPRQSTAVRYRPESPLPGRCTPTPCARMSKCSRQRRSQLNLVPRRHTQRPWSSVAGKCVSIARSMKTDSAWGLERISDDVCMVHPPRRRSSCSSSSSCLSPPGKTP